MESVGPGSIQFMSAGTGVMHEVARETAARGLPARLNCPEFSIIYVLVTNEARIRVSSDLDTTLR